MKLTLTTLIIGSSYFARALAASQNGSVTWQPCPQQNASVPLQCGTLTVPLDYSDPSSNQTIDLELVKVNAVKSPRKGSILFNPGGPGDSGRTLIADSAELFQIITGGYHDLIGFDPRGTGYTIPYSCYGTQAERSLASLLIPKLTNSSDTALGTIWAGTGALAQACYETRQDIGEYVGTAFVARDMIRIAEALDDDGLLRYYGLSYGTILGATVAAMFPDKIDRMVLDGVVNPHDYYAGVGTEEVTESDDVFNGFLTACIANPGQCSLAQDGSSVEDLSNNIYQLLDTLKYNPINLGSNLNFGLVNYDLIKAGIGSFLYNPISQGVVFADLLHALFTNNLAAVSELGTELLSPPPPFSPNGPEALAGIECSDSALRTNTLSSIVPIVDAKVARSRILGEVLSVLQPITCARWLFKAKEIYSGTFQATTRTPLLFVGSPFDPVTPLVSARNSSLGFEGSVVLEHAGYGHTSTAQVSLCTAKRVQAYFVNGTLPPPGTVCQPDQPLYSNVTFLDALAPIANLTKRNVEMRDDAKLAAAIAQLNRKMNFRPRS